MKSPPSCLVAILFASFLILPSYASRPSESEGEQAIRVQIAREANGRIRLVEFRKTDGMEGQLMGYQVYGMEFAAKIEFTETCKWLIGGPLVQQITFETSRAVTSSSVTRQLLEDAGNPGMVVAQGQQVTVTGVIQFIKKESGWAVDAVQPRQGTPVGGWKPIAAQQPPEQQMPDKSVLDAIIKPDVEYTISFGSRPATDDSLAPLFDDSVASIQFTQYTQSSVNALISYAVLQPKFEKRTINLVGTIDGARLVLRGQNLELTMVLQNHGGKIEGRFQYGQAAGSMATDLSSPRLLDSDPDINYALIQIKVEGQKVFKGTHYDASSRGFTYPIASPLGPEGSFVYVPGTGRPEVGLERIILFSRPLPGMRVIPVFSASGLVEKITQQELESRILKQTGATVAALVNQHVDSWEKAANAHWAKFDNASPSRPEEAAAVDFSIKGIRLGDQLPPILARYHGLPAVRMNAVTGYSTDQSGMWVIKPEHGLEGARTLGFMIHKRRVQSVWIAYSQEDAATIGGKDAMLNSMRAKLGEPDASSKGVLQEKGAMHTDYQWTFPDLARVVRFSAVDGPAGGVRLSAQNSTFIH